MVGKIWSGDKPKLTSAKPVERSPEPGALGEVEQDHEPKVQSGSVGAQKQLDQTGLTIVVTGLHQQLDLLAEPAGQETRNISLLRSFDKQLKQLTAEQIDSLPEGDRWLLGLRLGQVLEQHGEQATALAQTVAKLPGLPWTRRSEAELAGPALVSPIESGSAHVALINHALSDPANKQVLAEVLTANPHSPAAVLDVIAGSQDGNAMLDKLAKMYPGVEIVSTRSALARDLAQGNILQQLEARMQARGCTSADIAAFVDCFAEVRDAFGKGAALGDDMQRTNWIHTRIEILHTAQAAEALGLNREQTLAALYGSLFSDAFKEAGVYSVATHNRQGAELVTPLVMSRHLDLDKPENRRLLEQAMRIAHEHQITPPLFMAGAVRGVLLAHIEATTPEGPARDGKFDSVLEISDRMMHPWDAQTSDGEMRFSKEAEALLGEAKIPGWAVPYDSAEHRSSSMAAIAGDVWQYISPDGLMKYTHDLRDPDHPVAMFRDPVVSMRRLEQTHSSRARAVQDGEDGVRIGAAESSLIISFDAGLSAIDPGPLKDFMSAERDRILSELDVKIFPEVERRLRAALGVTDGPTPDIAYWNRPVSTDGAERSPEERAQIDLVKKTIETVLAEFGGIPAQPFGPKPSEVA